MFSFKTLHAAQRRRPRSPGPRSLWSCRQLLSAPELPAPPPSYLPVAVTCSADGRLVAPVPGLYPDWLSRVLVAPELRPSVPQRDPPPAKGRRPSQPLQVAGQELRAGEHVRLPPALSSPRQEASTLPPQPQALSHLRLCCLLAGGPAPPAPCSPPTPRELKGAAGRGRLLLGVHSQLVDGAHCLFTWEAGAGRESSLKMRPESTRWNWCGNGRPSHRGGGRLSCGPF